MINITFPDGAVKPFVEGITAYEIAESISPRLAADVLAAQVNGVVYDLNRPIDQDATISLLKWDSDDAKRVFWMEVGITSLFSLTGATTLGCRIRLNSLCKPSHMMAQRIHLKPPEVEPEQAPANMRNNIIGISACGHKV